MQPDAYVAPARYPLTVLHRPAQDGTQTVCALPMDADELWMPVDSRDGDLLCTGCMLPGNAGSAAEDAEGVLF